MGRWLVLAVAIAGFGALAGCGATGEQTRVRLARFSGTDMEFSYPAGWRAQYPEHGLSLEASIIVTLSTVRLRDPCRRLSANSGECGINLMIKRLPPGGVFVAWTTGGLNVPPNYPVEMPGVSTTVGGRRAQLSFSPPARECGWLRPTQAITAYVAGQVQMTACTRDRKNFKDQVEAMLNSVKFKTPPVIPKVGS